MCPTLRFSPEDRCQATCVPSGHLSSGGGTVFGCVRFEGPNVPGASKKTWQGASNLPPNVSDAAVIEIQAEIIAGVVARAGRHKKYPVFNSRLFDMSLANGREQPIMAAVGPGGMFRFYDLGTTILDPRLLRQRTPLFRALAPTVRPVECAARAPLSVQALRRRGRTNNFVRSDCSSGLWMHT